MKLTVKSFLVLCALVGVVLVRAASMSQETASSTVVLSPLIATVKVGEFVQVTATAYDELGNVVPDAIISWLPNEFDSSPHCVSVSRTVTDGVIEPTKATITAQAAGTCGVGALSVTQAGRVILHQTAVSVTVVGEQPSPTPSPSIDPTPETTPSVEPTATPTPSPDRPCRLPNGKCRRGCICP